jgi:hypothetical protein
MKYPTIEPALQHRLNLYGQVVCGGGGGGGLIEMPSTQHTHIGGLLQ